MRLLQSKTLNKIIDGGEAKAAKYKTKTLLLALIPTLLFIAYVVTRNSPLDTLEMILLGLGITVVYVMSYTGSLLVFDCWTIAEMVSPRVLGRYRNFRAFVKILIDSPDRREVLRATKLYNDILEKNGFQNYLSTSEFVTNVYDRLDKQDLEIKERDTRISELEKRINELITIFMREFQKVNNELVTERNEKKVLANKLEEITRELLSSQEELKKLR